MPYAADLYPEDTTTKFEVSQWLEMIGDQQPGGGESFSLENGEATIVVELSWEKARSFVATVLGVSFADKPVGSSGPRQLHRRLPLYHPRFCWLRASTVSLSSSAPVGVAGVGTKVVGAFNTGLRVAKYQKCFATVRFTDNPWTFLEDADAQTPTAEANRYTYFDPVPSVEIISAEGLNNVSFAYSPGVPTGPPNTAIPAPFGTLMSKITYTLNWMQVPQEYISGPNTLRFLPSNILSCVGRVNSAAFMGFDAGTLLLQAPVFQRFRFPMMTTDAVYGYFGWNVRLPMQYFQPDPGPQVGAPAGFAGHQLVPWRENLKWYPCLRVRGQKLYPEADFATIFTHIGI